MKGHIRQRGKRSWAVVLDLGRDADGRRRQRWHTVHGTKKDAQRELARLLHELNTGAYVEPARMSVGEYLERWLADYAKNSVAAKTFERYAEIVRVNLKPALGHLPLPKLQPLHIQSYYSKALSEGRRDGRGGLSAQTVLHHHRVLHVALAQAVRWQLLSRNPADAVQPPRAAKTEMRALTEDETAKLLRAAAWSTLYMPILVSVTTGLRRGELLGLRWVDATLDHGELAVRRSLQQTRDGLTYKEPKTACARRTVTLPPLTVEALRQHKVSQTEQRLRLGPIFEDNDLVFPRPDGRPWSPDAFTSAFSAFIRRSGLPRIRFHDLRHSHASQLLRQGVHPKVVSERLGHSTVGITLDTYSHVLPGLQRDAALGIDLALRKALEQEKNRS